MAGQTRLSFTDRFIQRFYFIHLLVCLCHIPLRQHYVTKGAPIGEMQDFMGIGREAQVYLMAVLYVMRRYKSCATWEELIASVFRAVKACTMVVLWVNGQKLEAALWLVLCTVLGFAVQQPMYKGPSHVSFLSPLEFAEQVEQAKDNQDVTWVIEFYVTWADVCTQFASCFAELSLAHASETVKFGKVDVGFSTEIAKKYAVNIAPSSKQLPTLIMFRNGKPVTGMRLPPADTNKRVVLSGDMITHHFGLNKKTE